MFEAIKYQWKLRKLEKERSRLQETYAKGRKDLSGDELQSYLAEESSMVLPIIEEIDSLRTARLRQITNKLVVSFPDYNDKELWQDRYYGLGRTLSSKGFSEAKKFIRQERREKREGPIVWLTALTGLLGTATGLAAVLFR